MYMYPDIDDVVVQRFVMAKEWNDCQLETIYFNKVITLLNKYDKRILLDAGCGKGRLISLFSSTFKKIIAIDPDYSRLFAAKTDWQKTKVIHKCKVEFYNSFIQDFHFKSLFDCILCSHVLNHIKTSDINEIMVKLNVLLKQKGKLILLATNWQENHDAFSLMNMHTGKEKMVSEIEFNQHIDSNDRDFFPTRYFIEKTLKQLLLDHGFKIIFLEKYHGYPKTHGDNFIFATKVGNI